MKKLIFFFLLNLLCANTNYELNLYEKVLSGLFEVPITIYVNNNEIKKLLNTSDIFYIVNNCEKAILLFGVDFDENCKNKPIFATNYRYFKSHENIIGAFYWIKGRPQLMLKEETLKDFNITVPKYLMKYTQ